MKIIVHILDSLRILLYVYTHVHISTLCIPVVHTVKHGASNAKVMGLNPSEGKN